MRRGMSFGPAEWQKQPSSPWNRSKECGYTILLYMGTTYMYMYVYILCTLPFLAIYQIPHLKMLEDDYGFYDDRELKF